MRHQVDRPVQKRCQCDKTSARKFNFSCQNAIPSVTNTTFFSLSAFFFFAFFVEFVFIPNKNITCLVCCIKQRCIAAAHSHTHKQKMMIPYDKSLDYNFSLLFLAFALSATRLSDALLREDGLNGWVWWKTNCCSTKRRQAMEKKNINGNMGSWASTFFYSISAKHGIFSLSCNIKLRNFI